MHLFFLKRLVLSQEHNPNNQLPGLGKEIQKEYKGITKIRGL